MSFTRVLRNLFLREAYLPGAAARASSPASKGGVPPPSYRNEFYGRR